MNSTQPAGLIIRLAELTDSADLLALENRCFSCDQLSPRSLRHLLKSPGALCLVAVQDHRLTGNIMVLFRSNSRTGRIYSLAVDPAARGTGLGKKLIARAEQEIRARNCNRIKLEVRTDNTAAIHLYEQFGFQQTKIRHGFYEDGTDAYVFHKELN